jgi:hypothetical protein
MTTAEVVIVTVLSTLFTSALIVFLVKMIQEAIRDRHEKTAQLGANMVFRDLSYRDMRDRLNALERRHYELDEVAKKKKKTKA